MKRVWRGSSMRDLDRLRLLDLDDDVGAGEDGVGVGDDLGALGAEGVVGDRRALAGAGLDEDLVAAAVSSRAPAGVRATRYSSVLISVGTPTRILQPPNR